MTLSADEGWMAAALSFGRRHLGETGSNPAVGAILVKDGVVVGHGATAAGGRPHAETIALAQAGAAARGATLYVTLEPCSHHGRTPPCADAVVAAGVARVVSALEDPDPRVAGRGHARLREAGVAVCVGTGAREAARVHRGHRVRIAEDRPMVALKLAQTADGYAAGDRPRRRLRITGPESDLRVHMLRSLHDAIMIGAGTARIDDPLLTVRLPGLESRRPLRVVLDPQASLARDSRLAATAKDWPTLLFIAEDAPSEPAAALADRGVELVRLERKGGLLDLRAALQALGERGLSRVFCEGGPRLASELTRLRLVEEATIFVSPRALGAPGLPALEASARAMLEAWPVFDQGKCGLDRWESRERTE